MSLLWREARDFSMHHPEHVRNYVDSWPEKVHVTQAGFAGHVNSPVLKQFTNVHGWDAWQDLHDVDLTGEIHSWQPHILKKHVQRYMDNPDDLTMRQHQGRDDDGNYAGDEHPTFVKWQGKTICTDGNHRVAADMLSGKQSTKGWLYDADKHGFPDEFPDEHYKWDF